MKEGDGRADGEEGGKYRSTWVERCMQEGRVGSASVRERQGKKERKREKEREREEEHTDTINRRVPPQWWNMEKEKQHGRARK